MELSYGWTSYLAQGLQDPRAHKALTVLKGLRARPVPQALRVSQDLRALQDLRATLVWLTPATSTIRLRLISSSLPRLQAFCPIVLRERKYGTIPII